MVLSVSVVHRQHKQVPSSLSSMGLEVHRNSGSNRIRVTTTISVETTRGRSTGLRFTLTEGIHNPQTTRRPVGVLTGEATTRACCPCCTWTSTLSDESGASASSFGSHRGTCNPIFARVLSRSVYRRVTCSMICLKVTPGPNSPSSSSGPRRASRSFGFRDRKSPTLLITPGPNAH